MLNPPPEDQFRALVDLIYRAALEARVEAWLGEDEAEGPLQERFSRIARYMDAIHNLPSFLAEYDGWDQRHFELTLGDPETAPGRKLHDAYQAALKKAREQN